jgi:hypothetical protein
MGYACPVCGDPQADAEHLANHLAFTAMLGDAGHEDWLAEHAPDWDEHDADRLADVVTDHAAEVEYPQVFEDTVDRGPADTTDHADHAGGHQHDHDHAHGRDPDHERSGALFEDEGFGAEAARERAERSRNPQLDAETEDIMQEARELTERMREGGDDAADDAEDAEDTDEADADEAETE